MEISALQITLRMIFEYSYILIRRINEDLFTGVGKLDCRYVLKDEESTQSNEVNSGRRVKTERAGKKVQLCKRKRNTRNFRSTYKKICMRFFMCINGCVYYFSNIFNVIIE